MKIESTEFAGPMSRNMCPLTLNHGVGLIITNLGFAKIFRQIHVHFRGITNRMGIYTNTYAFCLAQGKQLGHSKKNCQNKGQQTNNDIPAAHH